MKILRLILATAAIAFSFACEDDDDAPPAVEDTPVASRLELRDGMRRLWTEHVFWTRVYLVETLADLPSKDATLARLLQNQTDLGDAMKPYYGDAFGEQLTDLLEEHIRQAGALIAVAAQGDTAQAATLTAQWREQANEIARFISSANPSIDPQAMELAMQTHLDTTLTQVTARLDQDWAADVVAYDAVQDHVVMMADALTDGTAAQYPRKVTEPATSAQEQELHLALRELWHDHMAWTRLFIISDIAALPDAQATTTRLLRNQSDLGDAIKPIYGVAAGEGLTRLLQGHIAGAASVLNAAKIGDQAALQAASAAWIANADEIARFLTIANPFLDPAQTRTDLRTHLNQLVTQVSNRLSGASEEEIATYDEAVTHMLDFSDDLAAAIARQTSALTGSQ